MLNYFEFRPLDQEEMSFEDIFIFSSSRLFFSRAEPFGHFRYYEEHAYEMY